MRPSMMVCLLVPIYPAFLAVMKTVTGRIGMDTTAAFGANWELS